MFLNEAKLVPNIISCGKFESILIDDKVELLSVSGREGQNM